MGVSLRDAKAAPADRNWIQAVYPEYVQELAEVSHRGTGVFPIYGEHGARDEELLARWFHDERSHPLLILEDGRAVGFALVSRPLLARRDEPAAYRMAEFFVRHAHRRRGVGKSAAILIFSRFAGKWDVSESATNVDAVAFWRRVVRQYTRGAFTERLADGEVRQSFNSAPATRDKKPRS
jgi:predicted acetyltransferase